MPFIVKTLSIPDVILIEPKIFQDNRGCFFEIFRESEFNNANLPVRFPQCNFSFSKKNVIRGLHYQKHPKTQGKIITVLKGRIWDVAVDIRRNSPTYLKWLSLELDDANRFMLYIPPGFAHGFLALSEDVHLIYKCTNEYDSKLDAGIRWNDPDIGIVWPVKNPILSDRDVDLPFINETELL
ncbi:MAG: dTDP-4-dehydrorhamnose 3,5-epimerase [Thermodesulfobacteriota bacterium]|nr:dTDP-4-dehydrorhamnose 3,5-epimerase [Thermodesulfobacteriota bacterium]